MLASLLSFMLIALLCAGSDASLAAEKPPLHTAVICQARGESLGCHRKEIWPYFQQHLQQKGVNFTVWQVHAATLELTPWVSFCTPQQSWQGIPKAQLHKLLERLLATGVPWPEGCTPPEDASQGCCSLVQFAPAGELLDNTTLRHIGAIVCPGRFVE